MTPSHATVGNILFILRNASVKDYVAVLLQIFHECSHRGNTSLPTGVLMLPRDEIFEVQCLRPLAILLVVHVQLGGRKHYFLLSSLLTVALPVTPLLGSQSASRKRCPAVLSPSAFCGSGNALIMHWCRSCRRSNVHFKRPSLCSPTNCSAASETCLSGRRTPRYVLPQAQRRGPLTSGTTRC